MARLKMGSITASCGHILGKDETIVVVREGSEDCHVIDGIGPTVNYFSYCNACAEQARLHPNFLSDDVPDEWWYNIGYMEYKEKYTEASLNHFLRTLDV